MMPRGPISCTRITADTPIPERHRYELTYKVQLDTYGEPVDDPEAVGRMFTHVLRDWNEGRHPFEAEMISNGMHQCLKRAIYEVICEKAHAEFGNEAVGDVASGTYTAKWYEEARKRNKKAVVPYIRDEPTVELREIIDV